MACFRYSIMSASWRMTNTIFPASSPSARCTTILSPSPPKLECLRLSWSCTHAFQEPRPRT
ncbi:hypothetical protein CROQUDRAFT_111514, partial [Cronartium quercuum f. sp. fusiforme G11]